MISFSSKSRKRFRSTPVTTITPSGMKMEILIGGKWIQFTSPGALTPNVPFRKLEFTQDELHSGPPYRAGGPFISLKVNIDSLQVKGRGTYSSGSDTATVPGLGTGPVRFVGGFYNPDFSSHDPYSSLYGNVANLVSSTLIYSPLEAYYPLTAAMRPQIEEVGGATFIGELRDVPRMLKQLSHGFRDSWRTIQQNVLDLRRTVAGSNTVDDFARRFIRNPRMAPKRAADEFLGVQFGWMPFVRDLKNFDRVYWDTSKYIQSLIDRNNKWDKRTRVFTDNVIETTITTGSGMKVLGFPLQYATALCSLDNNGDFAKWQIIKRVSTRVWSSAQFKFYRPEFDPSILDFDSNWNAIQRRLTLYGLRINPHVVWSLTPWSWLADWGTNAGSVIQNFSQAQQDGVVAKEQYLMHHEVTELVLRQIINFKDGMRAFEFTRLIDVKQRDHAASPYGFGLTSSSLSGRQISILGSLGISRFF